MKNSIQWYKNFTKSLNFSKVIASQILRLLLSGHSVVDYTVLGAYNWLIIFNLGKNFPGKILREKGFITLINFLKIN